MKVLFAQVKRRCRRYGCRFIAAFLFSAMTQAFAATPNWHHNDYGVLSQGESLGELLRNFAANYGLQAVVSPTLKSKVIATIPQQPAESFLQALSERYPFVWYFDGSVLYFYSASELQNQVFSLNYLKPSQFLGLLTRMDVWDNRFQWQGVEDQGVFFVTAPPRLMELIAAAANNLDRPRPSAEETEYVVRVFPLKYATATEEGAGGLVSMIRRLMTTAVNEDVVEPAVEPAVSGVRGQGLARDRAAGADTAQVDSLTPSKEHVSGLPPLGLFARIEADKRMNAIVVYDKQQRMGLYEQILAKLDQPAGQVEIEVTVMNVSTDELENLGINWRLNSESFALGKGGISGDVADGEIGVAFGQSSLTSVVTGSNSILARVQAMEQDGKAKIVSRPVVVTTNNLTAVINNTSTFYVRVAGQEEVDLFPVSVGAVLNVTPHLVREAGQIRVKMDVTIEDGQQTSQEVDSIPVVSTARIVTQAVVNENESLVLGGYFQDTEVDSETRIPLLHRLPYLGALFRTTSTEMVKTARLFMIKPKLLELDESNLDRAHRFPNWQ